MLRYDRTILGTYCAAVIDLNVQMQSCGGRSMYVCAKCQKKEKKRDMYMYAYEAFQAPINWLTQQST